MTIEQTTKSIAPFIDSTISFDFEYSILCANLKNSIKHLGLSLGDRACIALGIKLKLPIYTADKIWTTLKLDNIDIRLI